MGTNFYTVNPQKARKEDSWDSMNPEIHVGKRSAAGWYCWDCGVTLCKDGEETVHHGCTKPSCKATISCGCKWHNVCPKCGKPTNRENLTEGAAGRELGFNKSKPKKKTGVKTCSSFTWAMEPKKVKKNKTIYSEYGDKYSYKEFKQILEECPIQYDHMIGEQFS
jgi:hypothetical protein